MEEKKTVQFKKEEFAIKEYIKAALGKGKISKVKIEYTPIGEKIIISTNKPGLVIGKRGEKIDELTGVLKNRFKLENPHIEIDEVKKAELDAQLVADDIALGLERMGPLKFKVIAYRALQRILDAGALGAEIKLSGKLPGARAKKWPFKFGYLKKVGHTAKVVDKAQARAETKPGTVGIKVSILRPDAPLHDKITIDEELLGKLRINSIKEEENTLILSRAYPNGHKREGTNPKKTIKKKRIVKKTKAEASTSEDNNVDNKKTGEIIKQSPHKNEKLITKKITVNESEQEKKVRQNEIQRI